MQSKEKGFYAVAKDILSKFSTLFVSRPYIAIIDKNAEVHYIDDSPLEEQYLKFLRHFIRNNYALLRVGDHSFPLGGTNLGIFKLSPKAFVVLYLEKGPAGQLLSFKARMNEWAQKIDELVGEIETDPLIQLKQSVEEAEEKPQPTEIFIKKEGKGFKEIPFLIKRLTGKEKFPVEDGKVLQLCDGVHSINDIQTETKIPKIRIKEIIKQYQNKKWLEMKRLML